ncbi:MAG: hypothetical protein RTU30_10060 [Candidatus Thorarchaeota archaeon]
MLQSLQEMAVYLAAIIAAILLLGIIVYRRMFVSAQYAQMSDSDKLETPTYEEMDSGIKISTEEDDE